MDGTLLDSAPGVTASAAEALAAVGAPVPSPAQLVRFVGPPMIDSFRSVAGLDDGTAQRALGYYREAYARTGALQSELYEGTTELLQHLAASGIPMAVATSKIEDQAVRLARHFGIQRHFADVCGASDVAGRAHKADVIAESLDRLRSRGVDVSNPVMVGDRIYDVEGASACGMPTIFATWGYGAPGEASRSAAAAGSPLEVIPLILGSLPTPGPATATQ